MEQLIGLEFKRNKYGFSIWKDVVDKVWVRWKIEYPFNGTQRAEIMISGKSTIGAFSLDEIVFLRPLDFGQKLQQNKCQLHEIIQEEWKNRQKSKKE